MPDNEKGNLLVFQKKKYGLSKLLAVIGDAPHVEIKVGDINMIPDENTKIEFPDTKQEAIPVTVSFFKLEGKYILLTGHVQALDQLTKSKLVGDERIIKGRLVSTPGLKKARIVEYDDTPQPAPAPSIPPRQDFANRPRWKSNTNAPPPRSPYRERK